MRDFLNLGFCLMAAAALLTAAASGSFAQNSSLLSSSSLEGDVIAQGKGFKITQADLDEVYIRYSMSVASVGGSIPPNEVKKIESEMLEQLVLREIFLQKATEEDKRLAAEKAKEELDQILKRASDPNKLRRQVLMEGWHSYEDYVKNIETVCLCNVFMERTVDAKVSSEEARKYYDAHTQLFTAEEMFMGGFILFSKNDILTGKQISSSDWDAKKATAAKVLEKAQKGEDFEALMKTYSDDAHSRGRGTTVVFQKGQMGSEFDTVAFALSEGKVSGLIESPEGLFIVKVIKHTPKGLIPFADVEKKLMEQLTSEKRRENLKKISKEYQKEFEVVYPKTSSR